MPYKISNPSSSKGSSRDMLHIPALAGNITIKYKNMTKDEILKDAIDKIKFQGENKKPVNIFNILLDLVSATEKRMGDDFDEELDVIYEMYKERRDKDIKKTETRVKKDMNYLLKKMKIKNTKL